MKIRRLVISARPATRLYAIGGLVLALLVCETVPSLAKDKTVTGTIRGFECGDNCYLTIRDKKKRDVVGLCEAPECAAWNENVEMPASFKGRRVSVTVGTGVQVDGSGTEMGEMLSFKKIRFLN